MASNIFDIEDLNTDNKILTNLLYKRYGQYRSQAYTCLLKPQHARIKLVFEWVKTGKIKLDVFEKFCEDFVINRFLSFDQSDTTSMIKFVKSLK